MTTRSKAFLGGAAAILLVAAVLLEGEIGILLANRRPDDEAARLVRELQLSDGDVIAEIGAGRGALTVATARLLPRSTVYSTELNQDRLRDIRAAVRDSGLQNVEVREGAPHGTNLDDGCCAAVFMRTVYHHFISPPEMVAALHRALQPGGRLAIIEFEPRGIWRWFATPGDVPDRGGHGVPKTALVREVTAGEGFHHLRTIDRWAGSLYLAVFARDR